MRRGPEAAGGAAKGPRPGPTKDPGPRWCGAACRVRGVVCGGVGEGVAVWGAEGALVAAIDVGRTDEAGDVILGSGGVQG